MSVSVLNTDAGLSGKTLVTQEGTHTITGSFTFDLDPGAPFIVPVGSAVVANLDADKVDGIEGTALLNTSTVRAANTVLSGPTTGADAAPTFRTLVAADLGITADSPTVPAGGGSETFKLSGLVDTDDTQAALASGTEAVLRTFTIPANTFNADGRTLKLTAVGTLAADADNKTIRARLGGLAGTIIVSCSQNSAALVRWHMEVLVTRIGSNSQRIAGWAVLANAGSSGDQNFAFNNTTATATDTNTIDLVITGEGVNANDVVYEASWVEMMN